MAFENLISMKEKSVKTKGKFIVLEGGEGSGKSSCIQYLKKKLAGRDDVVFTREPGGTPFGLKLRELLLHNREKRSGLAELMVFCADRADHCESFIYPSLKKGKIVICDRFDYSTYAYQIFGRQEKAHENDFKTINRVAKNPGRAREIKPDLVVFLDVDPKIGLTRVKNRPDDDTVFDAEELSFHQRVREGYRKQIGSEWIVIDAGKRKEDVQEEVWRAAQKIIKN